LPRSLGITVAGSRVVSVLAMGVSLPDAALRLRISINTARTLLARAMAGTDTNSQIVLVRMVPTTVGLMQS
jgi:DNA-binding CsgD family transcriptional regulator